MGIALQKGVPVTHQDDLAARLARWAEVFSAVDSPVAAWVLRRASLAVADGKEDALLARELLTCAAVRASQHPDAAAIMREAAGVLGEETPSTQ
jgi:hypothetical protein